MREVRFFFNKKGAAAFISHLDLNRLMTRAINRAKLPVWYTEGFNPHPFISFALPLPLGVESERDVFDIKTESGMKPSEMAERLNAVLPEGVEITAADEPYNTPDEICCAEYEITANENGDIEKIGEILSSGELLAEKLSKQGKKKVMKQINILGYIKKFDLSPPAPLLAEAPPFPKKRGGCAAAGGSTGGIINLTVAAGQTLNFNPVLFADALNNRLGGGLEIKKILRKRLLLNDFTEFM
ncbi:MAG: TIGR03936 family radical SAM-associated protein [Oscillospiraceae bacterium]|nr:TIGR03936 family radical SAM-associated protein [Oscillospiraceae bacterium]